MNMKTKKIGYTILKILSPCYIYLNQQQVVFLLIKTHEIWLSLRHHYGYRTWFLVLNLFGLQYGYYRYQHNRCISSTCAIDVWWLWRRINTTIITSWYNKVHCSSSSYTKGTMHVTSYIFVSINLSFVISVNFLL